MSYDEPPTRRIPPEQPPTRVAGSYERDVVVEDPEREELRDRVKTLQTALALVGTLALVALGIALYTLVADDEEEAGTDRRGASPARVEALRDRVNELESKIENRATKGSVSDVAANQDELETQVDELAEQVGNADDSGAADDAVQAVNDLQADVQSLEQRIEDLEASQGAGGAP